jgi:hypothetical protein
MSTKPELTTPLCPGCGAPALLVPKLIRFRRRDRILPLDSWSWQCPGECPDPFTGERPFRFADVALMEWEETQARETWVTRFGEPMPSSERGKHPEPHRTVRVPVMLTPTEAARLDEIRGSQTRSEFLRQAIRKAG